MPENTVVEVHLTQQAPEPIRCEIQAEVGRTAEGRNRVLATFEDFCTVAQSVRAAVPGAVEVFDGEGARLK